MHKTRYKTIHARIKQLKTPIKHTDKSIKRKTRIKHIKNPYISKRIKNPYIKPIKSPDIKNPKAFFVQFFLCSVLYVFYTSYCFLYIYFIYNKIYKKQ